MEAAVVLHKKGALLPAQRNGCGLQNDCDQWYRDNWCFVTHVSSRAAGSSAVIHLALGAMYWNRDCSRVYEGCTLRVLMKYPGLQNALRECLAYPRKVQASTPIDILTTIRFLVASPVKSKTSLTI